MIIGFKHKGLELFAQTGSTKRIISNPSDVRTIKNILTILDRCSTLEQMNIRQYRLHKLTGKLKGYYSMKVNQNWRIIFQRSGKKVYNVNLVDYH